MTTPDERTRALLRTRQFLLDLAVGRLVSTVPLEIVQRAKDLLRHYSMLGDLDWAADEAPQVFERVPPL